MREKWIQHLVDPKTKASLTLVDENIEDGFVVDGQLYCETSGNRYPIISGVARFVDSTFNDETTTDLAPEVQTMRSFSSKWSSHAAETLGTDHDIKEFEARFCSLFGFESRAEFASVFQDGARCLDAGCGIAWPEWAFNDNPNVERYAVDISLSVESAYERTKGFENVLVTQSSLFELPFEYEYFDVIFSDGVLHHTGDAEKAFQSLCRHLKPGGTIAVYIYCVKPLIRELADSAIRERTVRMSFDECEDFAESMALLGKSLQAFDDLLVIEKDIPLLGIKAGGYPLQKFIYDHFLKCYYNQNSGLEKSVMTNIDWYHPACATHHTREEIEKWFSSHNIVDVSFRQPPGWEHSGFFVSGRMAY